MAKTPIDIPLVHLLYETYSFWHTLILKFPKSQRYTLGLTCQKYLLEILENILAAAATTDIQEKITSLKIASKKLDTLKLLIRLAKDCQCLPNPAYLELESKLHEAGRMLGGWLKASTP
ncbi:MAG: four helix bundle protein [Patescibacteria group bacterium]